MTWIKICGITNLEDALTAVEAGADALGFVFYDKSPRNVAPEIAREIVRKTPVHVERVGVFVGNNPKNFLELVHGVGLTASQLHIGTHVGSVNETTAYGMGCFPPGFKTYVSMSAEWFIESEDCANSFIASVAEAAEIMRSHPEGDKFASFFQTIFLDSGSLQRPGGTGMAFDWQKAAPVVKKMQTVMKVVVAGGLNPANVIEAIDILTPWGVDVCSGVESRPGKKDAEKVRAFVAAVRHAEKLT